MMPAAAATVFSADLGVHGLERPGLVLDVGPMDALGRVDGVQAVAFRQPVVERCRLGGSGRAGRTVGSDELGGFRAGVTAARVVDGAVREDTDAHGRPEVGEVVEPPGA